MWKEGQTQYIEFIWTFFFNYRPEQVNCLPACEMQENNQQVSFTSYPQKNSFIYRRSFCETAKHILLRTCNDSNR